MPDDTAPTARQFLPIPDEQRPPLQIPYQLRKVLSWAAAELPLPSAPHQRKKQAKSLHNPPPSVPSTVIFVYFKTNVKSQSSEQHTEHTSPDLDKRRRRGWI